MWNRSYCWKRGRAQGNPALTFDASFQFGECSADGCECESRAGDDWMPLPKRVNEGAVSGEVSQGRAHAPAGSRASAPRPGDTFDVQLAGEGKLILTRLEPGDFNPAQGSIEKRGTFSVGVLGHPINDEALKAALADFP